MRAAASSGSRCIVNRPSVLRERAAAKPKLNIKLFRSYNNKEILPINAAALLQEPETAGLRQVYSQMEVSQEPGQALYFARENPRIWRPEFLNGLADRAYFALQVTDQPHGVRDEKLVLGPPVAGVTPTLSPVGSVSARAGLHPNCGLSRDAGCSQCSNGCGTTGASHRGCTGGKAGWSADTNALWMLHQWLSPLSPFPPLPPAAPRETPVPPGYSRLLRCWPRAAVSRRCPLFFYGLCLRFPQLILRKPIRYGGQ